MIVSPDEGHPLAGGPTKPVVKVGPHVGSSRLGLLESEVPAGGGFPAHIHDGYEEAFYVISGDLEYLIRGAWQSAGVGSVVFVPAGQPHGFRNRGTAPARHLAIAAPADAMTMIEQLVAAGPADQAGVLARFNSRFVASP